MQQVFQRDLAMASRKIAIGLDQRHDQWIAQKLENPMQPPRDCAR
jgi:hypothetical protein